MSEVAFYVEGVLHRHRADEMIPWDDARTALMYHDNLNGLADGTYWGEWDVFV